MNDLLSVALRASTVYIFVILAIRLFGKKELSQLSVVDLVFILLISNAVQNAMVGNNTSLPAGIVAALSLFAINYIFKLLLYRSKKFSDLVQGNPLMLVYKGVILKDHLSQSKITEDELHEVIREHGVKSLADVDLAILEVDGNISILSENYRKKSVRKRKAHKIFSKVT